MKIEMNLFPKRVFFNTKKTLQIGVLFLGVFLFLGFISSQKTVWAKSQFFVHLENGTAGQNLPLQVSGLLENEPLQIVLIRPDQNPIQYQKTANDFGRVNLQIHGLHLQKSGLYKLKITRKLTQEKQEKKFTILPGSISAFESKVHLQNPSIPADGVTPASFSVMLRDVYRNPIKNKRVQAFSSRNTDQIEIKNNNSDQNGSINGLITSQTPGISTLSVLIEDILIFEKPEIIFHLSQNQKNPKNSGSSGIGQFLQAALFEDQTPTQVAQFSIETIPSQVEQNKSYSFKVTAKDNDGNIVPNYLGTIRFTITDPLAIPPTDYTFQSYDQGSHLFDLSVVFGTAGLATLEAIDINDTQVRGSVSVTVLENAAQVDSSEKKITISTPTEGTVKASRVTVTGEALGSDSVDITDGDLVLVSGLEVDSNGSFFYQTKNLADGLHRFQVSSSDGSVNSAPVEITIDQSAPEVILVELKPKKVFEKGEFFNIEVSSSEPLTSVQCVLDEFPLELALSDSVFVGSFQAPQTCGKHPISCTVTDLVGNQRTEPDAEEVEICSGNNPAQNPGSTGVDQNGVAPTAVSSLTAVPGDGRVTLYWGAATDDTAVKYYRILYGKTALELNQFNVTPDARNQWYIENLENGTRYFFRVYGVDTDENLGTGSQIIESTTFGKGQEPFPHRNPTSGGSIVGESNEWLPGIIAFFTGILFWEFLRRRKTQE